MTYDHYINNYRVSSMSATQILAIVAIAQAEITNLEPYKTEREDCEVVRHINRQKQLCADLVGYLNNRPSVHYQGTNDLTITRMRTQILALTVLLERAIEVVRNVEAEGGDSDEVLQPLIERSTRMITAALQEHGVKSCSPAKEVAA